jgi:precorrin-2 dehydrogenase/sirohydrochlorin ferrochelatase
MPDQNPLFPVFLKLENLRVLLVGGGNVGLEKLTAILRSSPATAVTIISLSFLPELRAGSGPLPAHPAHRAGLARN